METKNALHSTIEKFYSDIKVNDLKLKNIAEFIFKVIKDSSSITRDELINFIKNMVILLK